MRLSMTFKEYLRLLRAYSNAPLTLNRITLPFGVISDSGESSTLLVGHVLDDLSARLGAEEAVDFVDVAVCAFELGHEQAGPFLDEAPYILSRITQELGVCRRH